MSSITESIECSLVSSASSEIIWRRGGPAGGTGCGAGGRPENASRLTPLPSSAMRMEILFFELPPTAGGGDGPDDGGEGNGRSGVCGAGAARGNGGGDGVCDS